MYAAVRLADQVPRVVHEVFPELAQEEVVRDDGLGFPKLLLRSLKVELDVELLEELRDRVLILVLLHLDDLDNFADRMANARGEGAGGRFAREDGCGSEIAQDPWRGRLDGVEVGRGEEGFEKEGASLGVVEVDEEGPMEEPCARVEL